MTLTPESVAVILRRRLDGEPSVPVVDLCNQAGAFIASGHDWSWLTRMATVRLGANQDRIYLPEDMGRIMPPITPNQGTLLGSFELRTLAEVLVMRNSSYLGTSYCRFGAMSYAENVDGILVPVLEVFPSAGDTSVEYNFFYKSRWKNVTKDNENLRLPPWPELEAIFYDVATAYSRSYDMPDEAPRSSVLADILMSPDWVRSIQLDGSAQSEYGPVRGGAMWAAAVAEPEVERVIPGGPLDLA